MGCMLMQEKVIIFKESFASKFKYQMNQDYFTILNEFGIQTNDCANFYHFLFLFNLTVHIHIY